METRVWAEQNSRDVYNEWEIRWNKMMRDVTEKIMLRRLAYDGGEFSLGNMVDHFHGWKKRGDECNQLEKSAMTCELCATQALKATTSTPALIWLSLHFVTSLCLCDAVHCVSILCTKSAGKGRRVYLLGCLITAFIWSRATLDVQRCNFGSRGWLVTSQKVSPRHTFLHFEM